MKTMTLILVSILTLPSAFAFSSKPPIDNSQLNVPLKDQIKNEVRQEVVARLGKGTLHSPRYFVTIFSFEDEGNHAKASHTFATYVRVNTDKSYKASNIGWLPATFKKNPLLCVFEGPFSLYFTSANQCQRVEGHNYTLEESIAFAVDFKRNLGKWGPYEITKTLYDQAQARIKLLESGAIDYIADDRAARPQGLAINCLHAVSDLDQDQISLGGFLNSGLDAWGFPGTRHVLNHYKDKGAQWMIDPIDVTNDIHEWIFVPKH